VTKARLTLSVGVIVSTLLGAAYPAEGPDSLAAARAMWSKAAPASYSYVVEHGGTMVTMCKVGRSEFLRTNPVKVSIRTGGIVEVATPRGRKLPDSCFRGSDKTPYTIDGLFDRIEREEKETNPTGTRPCLNVTFDATFGFPTKIDGDCYLDGDFPVEVRNFRVLK
jgi:hypothetical protein